LRHTKDKKIEGGKKEKKRGIKGEEENR